MEIEFFKSKINSELVETVNLRDLHYELEIGKDYSNWVKSQINQLGLVEKEDYIKVLALKGEKKIEYYSSIDIAKHIAMSSRTERGKQVRAYFIQAEKNLKTIKEEVQKLKSEELARISRMSVANHFIDRYEASCEYWERNQPFRTKNTFTSKISNDIYRAMYKEFDEEGELIYDMVKYIQSLYNTKLKPRDYFELNDMLYELYFIDALEKKMTTLLNADLPEEIINSELYRESMKIKERKEQEDKKALI